MIDKYRDNMIDKLIKIRDKIEHGHPLLLIEVSILLSIMNIENYEGTDIVNMLRNSTIMGTEHSLKDSQYYKKMINLLNKLIEGKDRTIETDSVNDTIILTSASTVTVPNREGMGVIELQIVPYIGTMITSNKRIIDSKEEIIRKHKVSVESVNPLEALFNASGVEDKEIINLIKSTTLIESREVTKRFTSEDEFYEFFEGSDGFIIKYDKDKYIVIIEINSSETEDGKDSKIYSILDNKLIESDASILDIIFY